MIFIVYLSGFINNLLVNKIQNQQQVPLKIHQKMEITYHVIGASIVQQPHQGN